MGQYEMLASIKNKELKTIIFLTFLLLTSEIFSQAKDSINCQTYKNALSINPEAFLVHDIMLTYNHRLSNKNHIEIMLAYRPLRPLIPGIFTIFEEAYFKDPYFLYGRFQMRTGFQHYFHKFYLSPVLLYGYGYFDKGWVQNSGNNNQILSRIENELELFIKTGYPIQVRHFLGDFYLGIGYRYKFMNDLVYEDMIDDSPVDIPNQTHPYKVKRIMKLITFHMGFQIGYCR